MTTEYITEQTVDVSELVPLSEYDVSYRIHYENPTGFINCVVYTIQWLAQRKRPTYTHCNLVLLKRGRYVCHYRRTIGSWYVVSGAEDINTGTFSVERPLLLSTLLWFDLLTEQDTSPFDFVRWYFARLRKQTKQLILRPFVCTDLPLTLLTGQHLPVTVDELWLLDQKEACEYEEKPMPEMPG